MHVAAADAEEVQQGHHLGQQGHQQQGQGQQERLQEPHGNGSQKATINFFF